MKNKWWEKIYHNYVKSRHKISSHRGSWMLTRVFINDYKNYTIKKWPKIAKWHAKGWSYGYALNLAINKNNIHNYINNRDYYSLHPYNGEYSSWIDDKLTLKYILNGSPLAENLPEYYFHLDACGNIFPLMDFHAKNEESGSRAILELLKEKGTLALKEYKGEGGEGFVKVSFLPDEKCVSYNSEKLSEKEFLKKIENLRNYLITEYFNPHPFFAKYCKDSVGSMRFLIGKKKNGELREICSFIRIGTLSSGSVDNYNKGGVVVYLNEGRMKRGHLINLDTMENMRIDCHPDNNLHLTGEIPQLQEIKQIIKELFEYLPQLSFIGIDICLNDKGEVKIIEINSLNSLSFQIEDPLYLTPAKDFFEERLKG